MGFLRNNLSLKLFAVFLSAFLWLYVKYTQNPLAENHDRAVVTLPVPLEVRNLSPALLPEGLPPTVTVSVRGKPGIVEELRPDQVKAALDVGGLGRGVYANVALKAEVPPGLEAIAVQPAKISFQLQLVGQKVFAVELRTTGKPAAGFIVGAPLFTPARVTATGPSNLVDRVARVVVEGDVSGADMDLVQRAKVLLVDAAGEPVPEVSCVPSVVRVTVAIRPAGGP